MDIKILKDKLSDSAESQTLVNTKKTETEIKELSNKIAELVIKVNALQSSVDGLDTKVTTEELVADLATIADLTGTNINADVFNSDKHSFTTGLTGSHLTIQPGTIVYARDTTSEAYCLVFWSSDTTFIVITPNQYIWQVSRDYTFGLISGAEFQYSYLGVGCSDTESTAGSLRQINSGCTLTGNLNAEYSGTTEFSNGIIVDELLQVEGNTFITGDTDIAGKVTITGDIENTGNITTGGNVSVTGDITTDGDITAEGDVSVTGNVTTNGNSEVDGTLTVKGNIIQQGEGYETHAQKLYTKNDLILTRDGAVSAMTEGEYTGIEAVLYDGENDGQLVFDKDGVARVGDVGDTQALMTREDSPVNGGALFWNSTNKQAVSRSVTGFYISGTCATAEDTAAKAVTIADYTLETGDILGISFINANTYGDTTLETPTYPTLAINNGTAYPICDSRGNYAGTGCWNAGDYIELRFTGDRFCIINSDIRQSVSGTSGYTIYSNGLIGYDKVYLDNKITPLRDITVGDSQVIGSFNGYTLYRKVFVLTDLSSKTDGTTYTISSSDINGHNVLKMDYLIQYDTYSCIGAYYSDIRLGVGVNSAKKIYYIPYSASRMTRAYIFVEYFE